MSNLIPFNYNSKEVRTILKDGEPWFITKDVAEILDISNYSDAVRKLDEDEKGVAIADTLGGNQGMSVISEAGLYGLIFVSRKPEAKEFKRWITHEVIPSIRKTGSYSMVPKSFAEALRLAADLEEQRQKLLPKAEAFDTFIDGSNLQTMNDVAKCLGIGRNKLFAFLRDKMILRANNTPYQEYCDRGYFEVKEKPIKMGDMVNNMLQTFVTSKGVDYISKQIPCSK